MDANQRRELIVDRALSLGEVEFGLLAAEFGVSEMTIRRDIEILQSQGLLRRVVGGAILTKGTAAEPSFESRASDAAKEKEHIAEAVVELLTPGETVLLDSGSTVLSVARAIRKHGLSLTIVTPSALAGLELSDSPGVTVHLIGGLLRPHELSMIGPDAVEGIKKFNCDTFVMGVAGIDARGGVSDYHYDEAHVKETGINVSNRVIVAADKSKLGRTALVKIADLSQIDILVTDADPDQPTVQSARLEGVQVVTISPSGSHQ